MKSLLTASRFAFVEYESRRDADDAYYEMHNKRIGRDDILKIEVGYTHTIGQSVLNWIQVGTNSSFSFMAF